MASSYEADKAAKGVRTRYEFHQSAELEKVGGIVTARLPGNEKAFSFPFHKWIAARAAGHPIELYFKTSKQRR